MTEGDKMFMKKLINSIINKVVKMITHTVLTVCNYRGSGFVDQALLILTSVVSVQQTIEVFAGL